MIFLFLLSLLVLLAAPVSAELPPMRMMDEGTFLRTAFQMDCVGTGIVCDFDPTTGRLRVRVEGAAGGAASTAVSLVQNGANCLVAGQVPVGVDASGISEGCFDVASQVELDAVTTGLSTAGTINTGGNPVDWTKLKNVPGPIADGIDDTVATGIKADINVVDAVTNWTIVNDAVTNAKMANMANGTIKGRTTAGTGDPEDLTATQLTAILDPQIATQSELTTAVAGLQPSDPELTTLAGLQIIGTGGDLRRSASTFTIGHYVTTDTFGNFVSGGDVATQAELNSFIPATATALVNNGGNCSPGFSPLGVDTMGAVEACFDVVIPSELTAAITGLQPSDPELTILAGLNVIGTGGDLRRSTGTFTVGHYVTTDANGNFSNGADVATQAELNAVVATLQPLDADTLTPLATKTIQGTGADIRLWTGSFVTNDCVKVDSNGNLSSVGAPCGIGAVVDGTKADIAVTGGGGAGSSWVVVPDAITNAKLNNVPTATIKGRVSATTGDPEDLTVSQVVTMLDPSFVTEPELAAHINQTSAAHAASAISVLPAGTIGSNQVQAALAELDSEKQVADPDLTTLAGLTIIGTGTDLRRSTGAFVADACVKVDASGNFTSFGGPCATGGGVTTGLKNQIDVVVAASDWRVAPDAVSNTTLANMASGLLKGRVSAGTGDPEDLTPTQVRTLINVADGANNYVHPNYTGDVTSAGTVTTIAPNAVTNSQLADIATNTIKGRMAAGTGDPQDLSPAQVRSIINVADGANNYVAPNHTGDVTSVGDGATTIAANAVTNAKANDMATATIKGRVTAATGDPEDLTATQVATLLDPQIATQTELNVAVASLQPASGTLTTLAGKTLTGTGTLLRMSTTIPAAECVTVDANGNFAGTGAACGTGTGTVSITAADCSTVALTAGQTCMQPASAPDPALLFYCPTTGGCAAGAAVSLPPVDTDTIGATSLQEAWNGGKVIMGVNSLANAQMWCTDITGDGDCNDPTDMTASIYCDPATGCQFVIKPDGDMNFRAASTPIPYDINFQLGNLTYMRINHVTGKVEFPTPAAHPLKSVEVGAHEFGGCAYTEEFIVAGRPKVGVFTCGANDNDGFDFDFTMPLNWNAGTVTVRPTLYSVAGSPAGNVAMHCSGQAISDNEVISARATTNEQLITFGLAQQYREEQATSPAITLTNTPVAGDHIYMHCDINAAGSTTGGGMANVRINATPKVFYTVNSTSE